jgi:hypothetical protein
MVPTRLRPSHATAGGVSPKKVGGVSPSRGHKATAGSSTRGSASTASLASGVTIVPQQPAIKLRLYDKYNLVCVGLPQLEMH